MTLTDLVRPRTPSMPGMSIVRPAERLATREAARWVSARGQTVSVHTSNQLAQMVSWGIEPSRLVVFAEGAQWGPIRCALKAGVRQFVVESCTQVEILEHCSGRAQQVVVDDTARDVDDVITAVCESGRLDLVGLHHRLDQRCPGAHHYAVAVDAMVARMARLHRSGGPIATRVGLAGPVWGSLRTVAAVIDTAIEDCCARQHFPRPSVSFTLDQSVSPYSSNQ
jgi:diaminopimelate decarboxylase